MVLLPTTVVGSYSVPEWLERLKTEYYQRRISARHLAEIHDVAIRRALEYVPADRLMVNPDCGLRHLAPEVAIAKLHAMVAGVAMVRAELA
jgi:methionine synthase II (cobalamin-independent)